jgi:hypothetical protein
VIFLSALLSMVWAVKVSFHHKYLDNLYGKFVFYIHIYKLEKLTRMVHLWWKLILMLLI